MSRISFNTDSVLVPCPHDTHSLIAERGGDYTPRSKRRLLRHCCIPRPRTQPACLVSECQSISFTLPTSSAMSDRTRPYAASMCLVIDDTWLLRVVQTTPAPSSTIIVQTEKQATILFENSPGAIQTSQNEKTSRTTHVDVKYNHVRSLVDCRIGLAFATNTSRDAMRAPPIQL